MTPIEIGTAKTVFGQLWPHSRMTDMEWGVVIEKAARIDVNSEQAAAALRHLKATTEHPPSVAATIAALKSAEGPRRSQQTQQPTESDTRTWGFRAAEMRDEYGLTSFERRVLDDPKFAAFAKKAGNLDAERRREITARADAAGYGGVVAVPVEQFETVTSQPQEADDDPFF